MKGKFAFWMRSYTKSYSGLIKVYLVGEENGVLVLGDQMGDNATTGKNTTWRTESNFDAVALAFFPPLFASFVKNHYLCRDEHSAYQS